MVKFVESASRMSSGALLVRRHPQQAVEFLVARLGERMRPIEVDRLPREHMDSFAVLLRQRIVRQVRMKIEGGDIRQEARLIEVPEGREGRDFVRAFDQRRPKSEVIDDGNVERLHQRARVLSKPLLARHERVAMVQVFHLALLHVVGEADIVMRPSSRQVPSRFSHSRMRRDLLGRRLLLGERWSSPNTISVSVSARMRSSIGSL